MKKSRGILGMKFKNIWSQRNMTFNAIKLEQFIFKLYASSV